MKRLALRVNCTVMYEYIFNLIIYLIKEPDPRAMYAYCTTLVSLLGCSLSFQNLFLI